MAVALTTGLISWVTEPTYGVEDIVVLLVRQFWLGLLIGIALGILASWALPWIPADLSGFAPVATVAIAALAYGAADAAGGSGFLCVYVVAVFIGNRPMPYRRASWASTRGSRSRRRWRCSSSSGCSSFRASSARSPWTRSR